MHSLHNTANVVEDGTPAGYFVIAEQFAHRQAVSGVPFCRDPRRRRDRLRPECRRAGLEAVGRYHRGLRRRLPAVPGTDGHEHFV